jgi:hypothetical protein
MSAKTPRPARPDSRKPRVEAQPARPAPSRPGRVALVAVLLLLLAVAVLYREIVFGGKVFFASDNQAATSFTAVGKSQLAAGSYPVWNPYLFSGMPSYGSLAYTPYVYPVNFVLSLLVRYLFFPQYTWLLFHTFLTGLGTFLLVRSRGTHAGAAMAAGVFMMWMPNLVAVGANGHGSQACAVAYLPFALYFWDRVWRGRGVVVNAAALAITLGLSMLRGHLQISYYTYALVGLHAVYFGTARVVDAVRGRDAGPSPVPPRARARLAPATAPPLRRALVDVGFAAAVLAAVMAVSLAMCAVLYGPVHDYAQYSIRGASAAGGAEYGYATSWSLHPAEMLTFLVPHSFGFGKELYLGHMPFTDYPNYLGVVVLAFALVALVGVRGRWVGFAAFVALVATLVSFGKFFPVVYTPLFKWLPYFSKFRVPVMVLIVQQLAVVVLFAAGASAVLTRANAGHSRRWALRGLVVAGAAFLAALFTQGYWSGGFVAAAAPHVRATQDPEQQRMVARFAGEFLARDLVQTSLIGLALAAAVFAFVSGRRMSATLLAGVVLVLGMVDYYRVDRYILHPERFRPYDAYRLIHDPAETTPYSTPDEMVDALRQLEGPFRIFPMDSPQRPFSAFFASNRFMVFGIESIGGYHPAKLSWYEQYLQALPQALSRGNFQPLDMMNVRYIVSGARLPELPRLRPVWSGQDFEQQARAIYENTGAFPRAWVAGAYRVATPEETPALLVAGDVDLRHTAFLDRKPAIEPVPGDSAQVTVVKRAARELSLAVELDRPGLVVVSEVYYPDWKATADGAPVEVLRANHVLRAVALGAGRHEIAFRYDASLLNRSAAVSVAAFALSLLVLSGALVGSWKGAPWKRSS